MTLPFCLVDAFTLGRNLTGNPAAVVVLPPHSAKVIDIAHATAQLRKVAAEMNQSETVFVQQTQNHLNHDISSNSSNRAIPTFFIRWFTPTVEVPLCGHATLAATHCLFSTGIVDKTCSEICFVSTMTKRVIRVQRCDAQEQSYTLTFPNNKPERVSFDAAAAAASSSPNDYASVVAKAVRDSARTTSQSQAAPPRILNIWYSKPTKKYLVELDTPDTVASLKVDINRLHSALSADRVASVTLTAQVRTEEERRKYSDAVAVSRHFGPWVGIPEDPVTGAAHTVLCPVFAERLGASETQAMRFFQAYPGRGGVLTVAVRKNFVLLTGRADSVVEGKLFMVATPSKL